MKPFLTIIQTHYKFGLEITFSLSSSPNRKKHSPIPCLGLSPKEKMTVPGELARAAQQIDVLLIVEGILKNFLVCCSFPVKPECVIQHAVPETKENNKLKL